MYAFDTPQQRRARWFNRARFILFFAIAMILTGLVQHPPDTLPIYVPVLGLILFGVLAFNEARLLYKDMIETAVRRRVIEQRVMQAQADKPKRSAATPKQKRG
jgi:hypothetical protein